MKIMKTQEERILTCVISAELFVTTGADEGGRKDVMDIGMQSCDVTAGQLEIVDDVVRSLVDLLHQVLLVRFRGKRVPALLGEHPPDCGTDFILDLGRHGRAVDDEQQVLENCVEKVFEHGTFVEDYLARLGGLLVGHTGGSVNQD
jgi:hypothetical protein